MSKTYQNDRQPRSNKSFNRNSPHRNPQNRILIVCEGETEKIYFRSLCIEYKLQSVVVIECSEGGTPVRGVELAIKKAVNGFDQNWCVLDTEDIHNRPVFNEAINRANSQNISLAISNPCIEYWFILHFEKTTIALTNAHEAYRRLRTHVSDYDKNQTALKRILPERMLPRTDIAIDNSLSCMAEIRRTSDTQYPSPSTTIGELVRLLKGMSKNKPY